MSNSQRHVLQKDKTPTEPAEATDSDTLTSPHAAKSKQDGLPWWWEYVWNLDIMKRGEPGTDIIFGDSAHVLRTNIEQIYGELTSVMLTVTSFGIRRGCWFDSSFTEVTKI